MNFTITKHLRPKSIRYDVRDETGKKIGERISVRNYVACMVYVDPKTNEARVTHTWFGRIDLIGKGDSRFMYGKPDYYVAYLKP